MGEVMRWYDENDSFDERAWGHAVDRVVEAFSNDLGRAEVTMYGSIPEEGVIIDMPEDLGLPPLLVMPYTEVDG